MITAGLYRHYKGNLYRVLLMARNSTNNGADEEMVVYVSLGESHNGRVSVRTAREFEENVSPPGCTSTPRFERIGD